MKNSIISIKDLSVIYRDIPALYEVNLEIPKGELIAIIGPNGAGKSTLVKTILDLIKPNTGKISINGIDHQKLKNKHDVIAYVPQRETVSWDFPINCLEVTVMGRYGHLGWFKRPGKKENELARNALKKFDMLEYANRQIGELSGGQKQRVFLSRAYIQDADIYVLDEPFGGLDSITEKHTLDLFTELKQKGKTIIVVTHDLQSLHTYFDKVLLINKVKIAFGSPKEVMIYDNLHKAYGGHMHQVYHEEEDCKEDC